LHIYSRGYPRYCTTPTGSYLFVATSVYKYMTASRSGRNRFSVLQFTPNRFASLGVIHVPPFGGVVRSDGVVFI
ncbi:MAG: hypothetical protein LBE91_15560, partial [Tannerella sp.]|nr:hypothetical protein [Tannerella sp.]